MNKKRIRILALLTVLLTLTAVLLAGCKNDEASSASTASEPSETTQTDDQTEPSQQATEPQRTPGMYRITVLPTANGTVTADRIEAKEGESITLTVTPNEGYEMTTLIVNGRHGEETFHMPAEDVTVLARFGFPEDIDWNVYPNGDFFGSAGTHHSSDVLDMITDSGKDPYLAMDANKGTPLYAYVKGMCLDQFYLELTAQVTGVRSDEKHPKFGLMTNDGAEMVKFYLDMTTDKQVGVVGAVHQKTGKEDDWAGQSTWNLNKKLDLTEKTVKLGLIRDGSSYYFYVNGKLVAAGNDLSGKNAAMGIFSFGTSLKITDYKLIKSEEEITKLLTKVETDAAAFNGLALSENYFSKTPNGVYTLTTNSDAQHLVDDVTVAGKVMRETYYSLKGKISLTDADIWGQARILISADPQNEYFIALEKLGEDSYQVFTMSKANEEGWNDWRLIAHGDANGNRNSLDFEVIVNADALYFLVDDEICYTSTRVPMTASTVKFTGYNVGTTKVEKLSLKTFTDSAEVQSYLATKDQAEYVSRFQSRMDSLYNEYIVENGCAGNGGTLIFGDSNMDFWGSWEQDAGLTKYVNGYNVGIGGSTTKDWLHAYDRLIKPFNADRFVILVGGNDVNVWGDDGEVVVEDLKTLFEKLHADHPNAEIYYIYTTPSPSAYSNGVYTPAKLGALVSGAKTLCESLDYVQGIDLFDLMTTEDKKNSNESLFADDKLHMSEAGYKVFSKHLYEKIFRGETFGASGDFKTTNGVELSTDRGTQATVEIFGGAPQYAYLHNIYTDRFCFETQINVRKVLNGDAYPKFGIMTKDGTEMVKFFVDMTAEMTASKVGVVYQPNDGNDDWANSVSCNVAGMAFTGNDTVKLKLVREGKAYYFYVNDELVVYDEDGFAAEKGAVGIFSFNGVLTAGNYSIATGDEADSAIRQAKEDVPSLSKVSLSTNYFAETEANVYSLTTDSAAEHKVDDVLLGKKVLKAAYYSLSGKLTLTGANTWGQARILISADPKNEYFIALEKTGDNSYQIFTMSKSNEEGWNNWQLIESASHNGNRHAIDFEVIVNTDQVYFLIDNEIVYTANRVSMNESTVKFTGYNVGTTKVENLAVQVFSDSGEANSYIAGKDSWVGENFGVSEGTYFTTDGVDLDKDQGEAPTIDFVGGAPQYAYLHNLHTDKFCFETRINVQEVLNNDGYPKFGLLVNGSSEMVKFFVDMTPRMTATHVGVVYQPTGGGDDWAGSVSTAVPNMSFTGSDTVKLKLVREGRAYYFYVNDTLVLYDEEGFAAEKGAVGIFSFNGKLTASNYSVLTGYDANSAIQSAKDHVAELTKPGLTCNWFADNGNGVYTLTTDSSAEHKVDDLTLGGSALKTAYYSVKGKLTLSNAGDWGQARILISADARNEYFIALERTAAGKYQIFTMSKANQTGWDAWELILHENDNGTRNSIDFEVIVIGNKLYFLIDDMVVYTRDRVSMTQSTVKFTGYNVGTTTVENLCAEVFKNQQEAESYLAEKN